MPNFVDICPEAPQGWISTKFSTEVEVGIICANKAF